MITCHKTVSAGQIVFLTANPETLSQPLQSTRLPDSQTAIPSCVYLLFGHPGVGLFRVTDEQLKVHALLVQDTSLLPQLVQARLLRRQCMQLKYNKQWVRVTK